MYHLSHLENAQDNVRKWINLTDKNRYKNITINKENGLLYLQAYDLFRGQDYECHVLNPLYDAETIIEALVENRMEIMLRGNL